MNHDLSYISVIAPVLVNQVTWGFQTFNVYVEDEANEAVNFFKCLAVTSPEKAILFSGKFYNSASEIEIDFIIHHEVGHLINNHNLNALTVLRNEIEADTFAMKYSKIKAADAISLLNKMSEDCLQRTDLSKDQIKLIKIERWVRIFNLRVIGFTRSLTPNKKRFTLDHLKMLFVFKQALLG